MTNPFGLLVNLVMPKPLAIVPLMVGMGVMSMMSAKAGQKGEQQDLAGQAKSHGIKIGGIDFTADRVAKSIEGRISNLADQEAVASMTIEAGHAQAESDAKVAAAASGVSGQNVDASINEVSRTAQQAKRSLRDRVAAEKLQITTDYTDNYLNSHMKKGNAEFKERSSGSKGMELGLAFAQGFIGAM